MPSTGRPSSKTLLFANGASLSYTDEGPPERMMPTGEELRISSTVALKGRTTEKTFCSRMRRAISCEYCAPKSRTMMDWVSTDEFLRLWAQKQKSFNHGVHRGTRGKTGLPPCSSVYPVVNALIALRY